MFHLVQANVVWNQTLPPVNLKLIFRNQSFRWKTLWFTWSVLSVQNGHPSPYCDLPETLLLLEKEIKQYIRQNNLLFIYWLFFLIHREFSWYMFEGYQSHQMLIEGLSARTGSIKHKSEHHTTVGLLYSLYFIDFFGEKRPFQLWKGNILVLPCCSSYWKCSDGLNSEECEGRRSRSKAMSFSLDSYL